MTKLSPAAQAVLTAQAKQRCLFEWSTVNDPPCHPSDLEWNGCGTCVDRRGLAAALRVVAAHLPNSTMYPSSDWGHGWRNGINDARQRLLTIAAELDGTQPFSESV